MHLIYELLDLPFRELVSGASTRLVTTCKGLIDALMITKYCDLYLLGMGLLLATTPVFVEPIRSCPRVELKTF